MKNRRYEYCLARTRAVAKRPSKLRAARTPQKTTGAKKRLSQMPERMKKML